jgi:hypothetical protein
LTRPSLDHHFGGFLLGVREIGTNESDYYFSFLKIVLMACGVVFGLSVHILGSELRAKFWGSHFPDENRGSHCQSSIAAYS